MQTSAMLRVLDWRLDPHERADPEVRYRVRLLRTAAMVIFGAGMGMVPTYLGNPALCDVGLLTVSLCLLSSAAPVVERLTRSRALSTWWLLAPLLALLPAAAWHFGGLESGTFSVISPLVFLGMFLGGRWTAAGVLAIGTAEVAAFAALHAQDLVPPAHLNDPGMATAGAIVWVGQGVGFLALGLLQSRLTQDRTDALQHTADGLRDERDEHAATKISLEALHDERVNTARLAGRAEVALAVYHDISNALTGANVSLAMARRQLTEGQPDRLSRVADRLRASGDASSLTSPEGRERVASYLTLVATRAEHDRAAVLREITAIAGALDHVAAVIRDQQAQARSPDHAEPVDAAVVANEVISYLRSTLARHAIHLTMDTPTLPPVLLHRTRVMQILTNFLRNASDAAVQSTDPPAIRVSLRQTDQWLEFSVHDNGPGVSDDARAHLFEPGFTTKDGGQGVGLYTSARLAHDMGGEVVLAPGDGGATFALRLPLRWARPNAASADDGPTPRTQQTRTP